MQYGFIIRKFIIRICNTCNCKWDIKISTSMGHAQSFSLLQIKLGRSAGNFLSLILNC